MFRVCFFSPASQSSTCMMLCINVFSTLARSLFFFCKFCTSLILHVLRTETMAQSIINLGTLFCNAGKRQRQSREKRKSDVDEIYGDSVYIMNEYFQKLKCKKEGLCVYAVLRVNLFIANPRKRITKTAYSTPASNERCRRRLERRTTANYVIFLVLNS